MIIPEFIDILDWANSLLVDFPDQDIPILRDINDWKSWAEIIRLLPKFSEIPPASEYDNLKDWAMAFYLIMEDSD